MLREVGLIFQMPLYPFTTGVGFEVIFQPLSAFETLHGDG